MIAIRKPSLLIPLTRMTQYIACKGLPQLSTLIKPSGKAWEEELPNKVLRQHEALQGGDEVAVYNPEVWLY